MLFKKVFVPSHPLKKNLVKILQKMRVRNNAHQFCGLVLKVNEIFESSNSTSPPIHYGNINLKTDIVAHQLKFLIAGDITGSKKTINQLLYSMGLSFKENDFSDEALCLLRFLFEANNSESLNLKYRNSEEYIKHFITITINLLDRFFEAWYYFYKVSILQLLYHMQSELVMSSSYDAGYLLRIIFRISQERLDFSEEEKREIGNLMIYALSPIKRHMKNIGCYSGHHLLKLSTSNVPYNHHTLSSHLQKRSSLQCLLDFYGMFPSGNGTLLKDSYGNKINDSIKSIDNIIRVWCEYIGEDKVDRKKLGYSILFNDMDYWIEKKSDLAKAGASDVPESHTWWAESIKACFPEATRSCKPLKKKLVKRLKDMRVNNNVVHFLGLVLEAGKITEQSKSFNFLNRYGYTSLRAAMVVHQLKDLMSGDEPGNKTAKKIVERMEHKIESRSRIKYAKPVLKLLLEVNDPESLKLKYRNTEEYLRHLITATINYITCSCEFLTIQELLSKAKRIYLFDVRSVGDLLGTVFHIGRICSVFSMEEKRDIGVLMIETLIPIKLYIKLLYRCIEDLEHYNPLELSIVLQNRSALQFILDDYITFLNENGTLLNDFLKSEINDSIKRIDNLIYILIVRDTTVRSEKRVNSEDMLHVGAYYKGDFIKAGASHVPESHTWWADSVKQGLIDSRGEKGYISYIELLKKNNIRSEFLDLDW